MSKTISTARLLSLAAAVVLAACASGYSQFYRPAQGVTPELIAERRAGPAPAEPLVERLASANDSQQLLDAYAKRGYVLIGSSSFNSGQNESEAKAVEQGRKVGADLVAILSPRYTGTVTSSVPLTTPTSSTSYTNSTATAYGSGGVVNARGNSTTTTYGTQTTYIPIAVNRMDYSAGYFVKQRWTLGAMWRDLDDTERQKLQTNKGVVIRVIVDGSPAYFADLLPGDIVLAVNGEPALGAEGISKVLKANAGRKVMLTVHRTGQQLQKEVALN